MMQSEKRVAERSLMLGVILLVILLIGGIIRQGQRIRIEGLSELSEGWYRLEQGQKIPVTLPAEIDAVDQEDLVLYNDQLSEDMAGSTLTTRGALYKMKILKGGRELYAYNDASFPRNDQMRAKLDCSVRLPEEPESGPLTLVYQYIGHEQYSVPEVYVGSSSAVFRHYCANEAFTLVIVFIMVVMSVIAAWVAIYFAKVNARDARFMNVALFLLLCGAWCLLDSSLIQHLSGMSPVVCILSFYAFMTLGIPMLHFVRNTGEMKKYRILDVCILMFYINAIVQGLLNYFGVFDLVEMLFVTHLLLLVGVSVLAVVMIREYRERKNKEILTILWAFIMLALSGVLSLLLYWLLGIAYYGAIFECGILVFILILLNGLIANVVGNFRFKTEAMIYQKLSREDRLTGLKNRRAFDEFLEQLEPNLATAPDYALMFLDLNGLKRVNDHFGHNAGDELIIGAARCIETVFSAQGECYRIGGDEFCVILPDPNVGQEQWNEALDQEIQRYNQTAMCKLSIARGSSGLRDETGARKTLSDWKFEADQNMYRDKEIRKANEC